MTKLEQYLIEHAQKGVTDHRIRATLSSEGKAHVRIQPINADGETLDFVAEGNYLIPKR